MSCLGPHGTSDPGEVRRQREKLRGTLWRPPTGQCVPPASPAPRLCPGCTCPAASASPWGGGSSRTDPGSISPRPETLRPQGPLLQAFLCLGLACGCAGRDLCHHCHLCRGCQPAQSSTSVRTGCGESSFRFLSVNVYDYPLEQVPVRRISGSKLTHLVSFDTLPSIL